MLVVRIFLSDAYFMRLIWLCLAIHLEIVCVTCSLKLKVESITTAKSLAVGTGNSSLPRSDITWQFFKHPNTSNLDLSGFVKRLF